MKNNIIKALITVLISNTIFIQAFAATTEEVKQNAFGCLFRYVTVGLALTEDKTLSGFLKAVSERSNESLAHCSYEWSVKKDNVFEHDMMIVCYETADIMNSGNVGSVGGTRLDIISHAPVNSRSLAMQIIEGPDEIVAYLMFNENLYSKEKINNAVDTFSSLLDRILSENPEEFIIPPL